MTYIRLLFLFAIIVSTGCSNKATITPPKTETKTQSKIFKDINDIKNIPQKINYFANNAQLDIANQKLIALDNDFNDRFFNAWNLEKISAPLKDLKWPYQLYKNKELYKANRQPIKKIFFKKINNSFNFKNINHISKKGIVIKNCDIKNFPTNMQLYKDYRLPGEGYPFDYNQNTSIKLNTPIFVSHYSKDKIWAFVETPFSFGWILRTNIAFVDNKFISKYKSGSYAVAINDKFGMFNLHDRFESYIKIGTIFSIVKNNKNSFTIYNIQKDMNSQAILSTTTISKNDISKKPITLNKKNIISISNQLLNETYGWGGVGFARDCSSTTQDYFSPFGIWLPRNSYAQSRAGHYISFKGLTKKEKENLILKEAIPFVTLIYSKGHIMIYVGNYNNKPIIYHNVWGIKTIKDGKIGRHVIGKTVITTLELGKELDGKNKNNTLLNYIRGMSILIPSHIASK